MRDKYQKVNVPNLIAYETLAHHINKVDIGTVHNINPKFTTDVGNSLVPGIIGMLGHTFLSWLNFI